MSKKDRKIAVGENIMWEHSVNFCSCWVFQYASLGDTACSQCVKNDCICVAARKNQESKTETTDMDIGTDNEMD